MKVGELMTKEFYTATPSSSLTDIAVEMKRHNVGAMPVVENNRLVGIITDRDIVVECVAAGVNPDTCPAQQFMTANPITVGPDTPLEQAAEIMAKEQIHRLPVVENGRLVGMLSLGDLAISGLADNVVAEALRRISVPVRSQVTYVPGEQPPATMH